MELAAIPVTLIGLLAFVVLSYFAARFFKNRQLKEFLAKVTRSIEPPKNLELESGNAFFRNEVLVLHVCVLDGGVYLYKSMYCSSVVAWASIKNIRTIKQGKKYLANISVIDGPNHTEDLVVPWAHRFNELVSEKTWLLHSE